MLLLIVNCLILFYLLFFFFKGCRCGIWKFPGWGLNWSCSCQSKPQPQPDPNLVCDLHHSSRQHWIPNPLSKVRDWTHTLMDASWVRFHRAAIGTLIKLYFRCPISFWQSWSQHYSLYYFFFLVSESNILCYVSLSFLFFSGSTHQVWKFQTRDWTDPKHNLSLSVAMPDP